MSKIKLQTAGNQSRQTYVDCALQASFHTRTLIHGANLADLLAIHLDGLGLLRDLLRIRQLFVNRLRPRHGNDEARVRKAVVDGEVDAVLLDVGDDDGGGAIGFAHGCGEEAHGSGAEDEDCGFGSEVCAAVGVHGDGERLDEGSQIKGDGFRQSVRLLSAHLAISHECAH